MSNYKEIEGVKSIPLSYNKEDIDKCKEIENTLLNEGVTFKGSVGYVPWLVATDSFKLSADLKEKIEELGKSVYLYFDAIQKLYKINSKVQKLLDVNIFPDLIGVDLGKKIETFRLDIVVSNGQPKITEIEEIYGNAGKMHAMQKAYKGVSYDGLFKAFADTGIKYILYDDTVGSYIPELTIIKNRLKDQFGKEVEIRPFSQFDDSIEGKAWRFCYTKDLNQYDINLRKKIVNSDVKFLNPLFHGYASKAIFIPLYDDENREFFIENMTEKYYNVLKQGSICSRMINPESEDVNKLLEDRRNKVIKVVDSPKNLDYNWGSRGVYFGDTSSKRWKEIVEYVLKGQIPHNAEIDSVIFILSELVDSDKYSIEFWDRENNCISLMDDARVRLGPIFFRNMENDETKFLAGHATFVNTSRKVHLGKHAVCAPLEF